LGPLDYTTFKQIDLRVKRRKVESQPTENKWLGAAGEVDLLPAKNLTLIKPAGFKFGSPLVHVIRAASFVLHRQSYLATTVDAPLSV
jgi:hypothetical protein